MVYTSYKNGDDWGMVYYCFTHIICICAMVRKKIDYIHLEDGQIH